MSTRQRMGGTPFPARQSFFLDGPRSHFPLCTEADTGEFYCYRPKSPHTPLCKGGGNTSTWKWI